MEYNKLINIKEMGVLVNTVKSLGDGGLAEQFGV